MARKSRKAAASVAAVPAAPAAKVWRCAVYARLSCRNNGLAGDSSLRAQVDFVRDSLSGMEGVEVVGVYEDNGRTGTTFEGRAAFDALMDEVRAGAVDCIAVKDLSRFGRNMYETSTYLERIFPFLGVRFDAVYSGFLGSAEQIDIVLDFCRAHPGALRIVDPVMGDDGAIYKTYTSDMCARMRTLCEAADCITPNLTEACILLGAPYTQAADERVMREYARALSALGPRYVAITGIRQGDSIVNAGLADGEFFIDRHPRLPAYCSGTGDIFASVVTGALLSGRGFADAVRTAGGFVSDAIRYTAALGETFENGVIFEPILGGLATCEKT